MKHVLKYLTSGALLTTTMCVASSVHAEDQACVTLHASYAAKIRLTMNDEHDNWSDSFSVGSTKCKHLDGFVPVGEEYTVEVKAVLGESKHCQPHRVRQQGPGTAHWVAHGSVQHVRCDSSDES